MRIFAYLLAAFFAVAPAMAQSFHTWATTQSPVTSASDARGVLDLGSAATEDTGTAVGDIPLLVDADGAGTPGLSMDAFLLGDMLVEYHSDVGDQSFTFENTDIGRPFVYLVPNSTITGDNLAAGIWIYAEDYWEDTANFTALSLQQRGDSAVLRSSYAGTFGVKPLRFQVRDYESAAVTQFEITDADVFSYRPFEVQVTGAGGTIDATRVGGATARLAGGSNIGLIGTVTNHDLTVFTNNGSTQWTFDTSGGLFSANATGGDQGADTINAGGLFVDGNAVALLTTLASTSNGNGASLIGIEDSGTLITATTVEGALAENRTAINAKLPLAGGTMTGNLSMTSGATLNIAQTGAGIKATVQGEGESGFVTERYNDNANSPVSEQRKARGTIGTPADIVQNDRIFQFSALGRSSGAFRTAGAIRARVLAASPSSSDMEMEWEFTASPAGSAASTTSLLTLSHASGIQLFGNKVIDENRLLRLRCYTVAALPAAGTAGRRACVTDAVAPTFLGALTGGGSAFSPVVDTGSAWVSG